MAEASRTFRIFVSSTFTDLKAERDALQQHVFPRLRELCERHRARFQAIDLRWGISEEAAFDQQTVPICLVEIKRCQTLTPRPNFVILLGDRYGWRALPASIPVDEFEAILESVAGDERELLLWSEQQPKDRKGWYRRDDNALPSVYDLQSREGRYRVQEIWESEVERPLRSILRRSVDALGFSDDQLLKYVASATEQEIERGALAVPDAHQHVFAFFRTLTTAPGLRVIDDLPADPRVLADYIDLIPGASVDGEARGRLEDLKRRLRERLSESVFEYETRWHNGEVALTYLGELPASLDECLRLLDRRDAPRTLCMDLWRKLAGAILAELERAPTQKVAEPRIESRLDLSRAISGAILIDLDRTPAQQVAEAQMSASFRRSLIATFVDRAFNPRDIDDYVAGAERRLCAIVAPPGSGISALLAKAAEQVQARQPGAVVICRFVGVSRRSSDIRGLLADLCMEIAQAYGYPAPLAEEYRELWADFLKRLALASLERPLVLFLAALDQLSQEHDALDLEWLPAQLPEHTRVVVSAGPGLREALERKRPVPRILRLSPLQFARGPFRDKVGELVDRCLENAGRKLQPEQGDRVLDVLDRARESSPLYLELASELAVEEARLWKSHTEPPPFGDDLRGLIRENLFARLAKPEHHGELLVERTLAYLAASRAGLAEDELLDILADDDELYADVAGRAHHELPAANGGRRLPVVLWSRLYLDLEPYLVERYLTERRAEDAPLLVFFHRQLHVVATETYLAGDRAKTRHAALAAYFRSRGDPQHDGSWTGSDPRGVSELPFHLIKAGHWEGLHRILTNFRFLERTTEVGMVEQLRRVVDDNAPQLRDQLERSLAGILGGTGDDQAAG